jgi:hypothetical protein
MTCNALFNGLCLTNKFKNQVSPIGNIEQLEKNWYILKKYIYREKKLHFSVPVF